MVAYLLDVDRSTISTRVSPAGPAANSAVAFRFTGGSLDVGGKGWVDIAVDAWSLAGSPPAPPDVEVRLSLHARDDEALGLELPVGDRSITLRTEPRVDADGHGVPFTATGKVLLDPAVLGIATPTFLNTMVHIAWSTVWVPVGA